MRKFDVNAVIKVLLFTFKLPHKIAFMSDVLEV